jgi:tetratricopeptide (TPR) repeat protein
MIEPINREAVAAGHQLGRRQVGWAAVLLLAGLGLAGAVIVIPRLTADPNQLWSQARADYEARRFDQAAAKLDQLARLRPPTGLDELLRGEVAVAGDHIDDALAHFGSIPDSDPMASRAWLRRAQLERGRHRIRVAEEALLHALKLDPSLVQARRELIYIYGMQLRRREFREQFSALADLIPLTFSDVFTWCLMGNVIWEAREVSADLAEFVRADPTDRASRLALVETLLQLRQLDEAASVLSVLPDSDPDARAVRARMAIDRGDDEATEKLLADGPVDHPVLARLRGQLAYIRKDWKEAVHHLRLSYAAEPDNRNTLFMLGSSLRELGDVEGSKRYLEAAANQDRLNGLFQIAATFKTQRIKFVKPEVLHELAVACEAANLIPEARAWYHLALGVDPVDRVAQQGLFRLNQQAKETAELKESKKTTETTDKKGD